MPGSNQLYGDCRQTPTGQRIVSDPRRFYGTAKVEVLAFTTFGIENLIEMIAMERGRQP